MATTNITAENFESIIKGNDIVIIDFWAEWCSPCKSFAPTYEKVSESHPDIVFGKIDTETEKELGAHFQIRSIPTIMVFREEIILFSQAGALQASGLADVIGQVKKINMDNVRAEIAKQNQKNA